jgi:hypothetical protein
MRTPPATRRVRTRLLKGEEVLARSRGREAMDGLGKQGKVEKCCEKLLIFLII